MLKMVIVAGCLMTSSAALGQTADPATLAHASNLCELHRHRDIPLGHAMNAAQISAAPWVYDQGFEKCEAVIKQNQAAKAAHELEIINGISGTIAK